jgi:hypothetical protein
LVLLKQLADAGLGKTRSQTFFISVFDAKQLLAVRETLYTPALVNFNSGLAELAFPFVQLYPVEGVSDHSMGVV